jgi:hypothetical protein
MAPWSGFREALAIFFAEYSAKAVVELRYYVSPVPFRLVVCLGESSRYGSVFDMDVLVGSCRHGIVVFEFFELIKCLA